MSEHTRDFSAQWADAMSSALTDYEKPIKHELYSLFVFCGLRGGEMEIKALNSIKSKIKLKTCGKCGSYLTEIQHEWEEDDPMPECLKVYS